MQSKATNIAEYLIEIPEERQQGFNKLRQTILENILDGFQETICYGMIGYVVPHSIYPKGYHCDTKLPLPFISIANQKNFVAIYHMGIYIMPELLNWFVVEFPKHSSKKLDMGKSCMRFKNANDIPFELIGELIQKVSTKDWINTYEANFMK